MNRADQRKFHVIYKTTCIVTGKFYLGMHSTDNLDDGYLGSGSILSRSIKKYGKEKHTYEVLEFLPDRKTLSLREEQLITPELRANPMCMNIRTGGTGNQPGKALKEETKTKMSASLKQMWEKLKASGYQKPKQSPEQIANRVAKNTGQKRSEETKQRMKEAQARHYATVTPEKRAAEHANRSNAKAQQWIVETPQGTTIITNVKTFAEENGLSMSKLYKTVANGKYCNGYRIMRKS
jgi:group I intron endonuclease